MTLQRTLFERFRKQSLPEENHKSLHVCDLFSGVGGFSFGAKAAGHKVVLAADSDSQALKWHSINHPEAQHVVATFPAGYDKLGLNFNDDSVYTHLHGSPPCTLLSSANCAVYYHRE